MAVQVLLGTSDGPVYEGGSLRVRVAVLADDGRPYDLEPDDVAASFEDEAGAALAGGASLTREDDDAGQATAAGADTLTDTDKDWRSEAWRGALVQILTGTGAGQLRRVLHNDEDTLTLDPMVDGEYVGGWETALDATSTYALHRAQYRMDWEVPAGTAGTLVGVRADVEDPAGAIVVRRCKVRVEEEP